jgi:signal peptidase I
MRKWLLLIPLLAAAGWARVRYVPVVVRGHSMSEVLADGQRVLARRDRQMPKAGDLILFRPSSGYQPVGDDSELLIKRVIALAGDPRPAQFADTALQPIVPTGYLAVAGESRLVRSMDSRSIGYVPIGDIIGRVVWPRGLSRLGGR